MKIKFEYPWPVWTPRDSDLFNDITLYNMSFMTIIQYFKNHNTGYEELVIKLLGFGVRFTWNS